MENEKQNGWGGARKGAGRKKVEQYAPKKYRTVSFCVLPEQEEQIRALAKKKGVSLSQLIVSSVLAQKEKQ